MSLHERIMEQAADTVERYKPTPWVPRGILASEGLALCTMLDLYKTDTLLESGLANGRSAMTMAGNCAGLRRFVCDQKLDHRVVEILQRMGTECYEGDAIEWLPEQAKFLSAERLGGIFIDGPKGMEAVKLAVECIRQPHVQWVGVHDVSRALHGETRSELHAACAGCDVGRELGYNAIWATDHLSFAETYSWLDVNDSQWDEEQGTRWFPFNRLERGEHFGYKVRPYGSYGYTIGFLCKTPPSP